MGNTNCLDGMACPECGSLEPFRIAISTMATVTDFGIEDTGDNEWLDDSFCECEKCDFAGTIQDFRIDVKNPFTVIGTCENADSQAQPWVEWVEALNPKDAATKAIVQRAKDIDVDDYEPVVIEVFKGKQTGLLGNWYPMNIEELDAEKAGGCKS